MTGLALARFAGLVLTLAAAPSGAEDLFDFGNSQDDTSQTETRLIHGSSQFHDLHATGGIADQDWMVVLGEARRSYEARAVNIHNDCNVGTGEPAGPNLSMHRVDGGALLLTNPAYTRGQATVRWTGTGVETSYVRVLGNAALVCANCCFYTLEFHDTTLFAPRWNNAGTQVTVFVVQNTTSGTVTGDIFFYDVPGSLLHTQAISMTARGAVVLNTATIPQLQGLSGVASIAHDGGWGGLTGKAVVLDPGTGFSFDTPFTTLPTN